MKNSELAENLAFSLLSHTSLARPLAEKWLAEDAPSLLRYSALLALSRMRGSDGRLPDGVDGDALAAVLPEMGAYWCARRLRRSRRLGRSLHRSCSLQSRREQQK